MFFHHPKKKSAFAQVLFASFGIFGWISVVNDPVYSLPLAIFYAVLLLNTFFSVTLFSQITPLSDHIQHLFDAALIFVYAILAFSFGNVTSFCLASVFLFIIASAKYSFMLNKTWHPKLFKRKIIVDISGTFGCALALAISLSGNEIIAAWLLSLGFAIANVLLFFVWPLYRTDPENV